MNELISVLLSVHNDETNINKAIESILTQKYENIELLLIDDASTDSTYDVCKEYSDIDSRIKLFKNNENQGLTKSLNKLIKESNGVFIARQDSDDISYNDRLVDQYNLLINSDFHACTSLAKIKGTTRVLPGFTKYLSPNITMKFKNPFIHGTLLIKNRILEKLGGYDSKFKYSQDYKLMKDLIDSGYKISIMKQKLYNLNMEGNISTLNKVEQEYYAKCVRKNLNP